MKLIDQLRPGPLDIIGDVHGDLEALQSLLSGLGYRDGRHPAGRRLVFVGDLTDRGPDSPGVLRLVMGLVREGNAQCIAGNHELNLLRNVCHDGNEWWTQPPAGSKKISEREKAEIAGFLSGLPLVLERADLRIVHAAWHQPSVDPVRNDGVAAAGLVGLCDRFDAKVKQEWKAHALAPLFEKEEEEWGARRKDKNTKPPMLPAHAEHDTLEQTGNPVRVLTSGLEEPCAQPFWANGKWRFVRRMKWWERYEDDVPVIMGHYWRRFSEAPTVLKDEKDGPDLFEGIEPQHWMGRRRNIYCVDFSIGNKPIEKKKYPGPPWQCKLAALRTPDDNGVRDWTVLHHSGEQWEIGPPGLNV